VLLLSGSRRNLSPPRPPSVAARRRRRSYQASKTVFVPKAEPSGRLSGSREGFGGLPPSGQACPNYTCNCRIAGIAPNGRGTPAFSPLRGRRRAGGPRLRLGRQIRALSPALSPKKEESLEGGISALCLNTLERGPKGVEGFDICPHVSSCGSYVIQEVFIRLPPLGELRLCLCV
jgi:hypothetical protein